MPVRKLAGVSVHNIDAALEAEDAALTQIQLAVSRQLTRLQMEEQLLKLMLRAAQKDSEAVGKDSVGPGLKRRSKRRTAGHDASENVEEPPKKKATDKGAKRRKKN